MQMDKLWNDCEPRAVVTVDASERTIVAELEAVVQWSGNW